MASQPTSKVVALKTRKLSAATSDALRNTSRSEFVFASLRDAIWEGRFAPGERIPEEEVAHSLGVSRTPVRDALRRLQERGLLVVGAGRALDMGLALGDATQAGAQQPPAMAQEPTAAPPAAPAEQQHSRPHSNSHPAATEAPAAAAPATQRSDTPLPTVHVEAPRSRPSSGRGLPRNPRVWIGRRLTSTPTPPPSLRAAPGSFPALCERRC